MSGDNQWWPLFGSTYSSHDIMIGLSECAEGLQYDVRPGLPKLLAQITFDLLKLVSGSERMAFPDQRLEMIEQPLFTGQATISVPMPL
jgi:hypothetical protein